MKKAYLKPDMEVMLVEQTQMLCSSTVINPGGPNIPAGVKGFSDWDIWNDEGSVGSNSDWDDDWSQ